MINTINEPIIKIENATHQRIWEWSKSLPSSQYINAVGSNVIFDLSEYKCQRVFNNNSVLDVSDIKSQQPTPLSDNIGADMCNILKFSSPATCRAFVYGKCNIVKGVDSYLIFITEQLQDDIATSCHLVNIVQGKIVSDLNLSHTYSYLGHSNVQRAYRVNKSYIITQATSVGDNYNVDEDTVVVSYYSVYRIMPDGRIKQMKGV